MKKQTATNPKPRSIVDLLNEKRADKIPSDYKNLAQLADEEGANSLSSSWRDTVNEAVKAGILLRKHFKVVVKVGDGTALRAVAHYKRVVQ
jgi:NAD kinase